ncbi:pilus assembly protein [Sphingomonas adhaesiva]|uniref:pilus assembly protein n=1 Tax=Sphingomonas adhaesiva TaxID=28212 RepID=UPI002FF47A0E
MMMTAVGVIPLLAMIGGAVDASRIYMSYARLQQACDAGALAGRKAMANVTALTATEQAKANEFFDFNFPAGTYSGQNVTRTFAKGADGVVVGTASVTMPTTIMKMFGYTTVPVNVSCQATLNIPNTDVMFVLDVTGSMARKPDGSVSSTGTDSKLAGLKQAVKDFYAALGPGAASGPGRVRYGFMPYSSNVNVGRIVYGLNPAYLAGGTGSETWEYQSRVAVTELVWVPTYGTEGSQSYAQPTYTTPSSSSSSWSSWSDVNASVDGYASSKGNISSSSCSQQGAPADKLSVSSWSTPSLTSQENMVYPDNSQTKNYSSNSGYLGGTLADYRYGMSGSTCKLQQRTARVTAYRASSTETPVTWRQENDFKNWNYVKRTDIDVSGAVQNGSMPNPTYYTGYSSGGNPNGSVSATATWGGCIEEARTVNTIVASSSLTPPTDADDLKIDLIPTSIQNKWKPFLADVQFDRGGNWLNRSSWIASGFAACPREASVLTQYSSDYVASTKSSATFNTYVDSLTAIGGTYHDIGMIWGARFLSPDGIFSATNSDAAAPGRYQVSRNIVFMTDGDLDTREYANDPWGINELDGRIGPTNTDTAGMIERHQRRTEIICNEMQGKGFTVWVIGFGVSDLTDTLKNCASGGKTGGHWSVASDTATLRQTFARIAQTVGGLRLSS